MGENYVVNYDINVKAQDSIQTLQNFQATAAKMATAATELEAFRKKLAEVTGQFKAMAKKAPVLNISTKNVNKNLDAVITKLETVHKLAAKPVVLGETVGGIRTGVLSPDDEKSPKKEKSKSRKSKIPKNIGYRVLGPTMVDSTSGALDLVKGMGVAYGISGLGSLFGNVLSSATEYDNMMQTTKNILGTHDKASDFNKRFSQMAQIIRNVGVETKFTAPQVADASKFLAMAGMDINAINGSIRPIADIALVGDTDLGSTADVVTNIMTGYKISPENVRHAADVMTMTFTKSNTTLMEMAEAYKYSASLLSAGGIAFEESSASLGILGDAGIKGSQAGTTMRTIVSNLVNPTNNQLEQWNMLGIDRFGEDGKLRSLVDIFSDLNKADLYVDDFYKLFHKTAAQGAVALTQGVNKWNEIVEQNFLSDGLVSELAEAKKNTVQGLWAQLTSMFTENGMKAFEGLQAPIENLLKNIINWLKTPEAVEAIEDISKAIMELMKYLWDFTKILLDLYKRFKVWIEFWVVLQLALTAIIAPLRVFKSLIDFGSGVIKSVRSITALTSSFGDLFSTLKIGRSQLTGTAQALNNVAKQTDGAVRIGKLRRLSAARNALSGVGGMIGAGAGAYIGAGFGDPGSWQSTLGSLALSAGGSVLGSQLTKGVATLFGGAIIKGLLPSLLSNPITWALTAAAVIGGTAVYFKRYHDAVDRCTAANNDFLASTQSINGINYSERTSMADKYLSIVYNKQLDSNRAIGEHINLIREQLGLMKTADELVKDTKPFKDSHKTMFENAYKAYGGSSTFDEAKEAATGLILNPDGTVDQSMRVFNQANLDGNGRAFDTNRFNGVDYGVGDINSYSALSASRLLYGLGRDTGEGSQARKMIDNYNQRILLSQSIEDFDAVIKTLVSDVGKLPVTKGSELWTMDQIGENSLETNQTGYHYVTALRNTMFDQFRWDKPTTANAHLLETWKNILDSHTKNQDIPQDLLNKFLLESGVDMFNKSRYGAFESDEFMKNFGWENGKWNNKDFLFFNNKTGKEETIYLTAHEAQKNFVSFHQQIIDIVHKLSPKIQPYFSSLIDSPIWGVGNEIEKTMLQRKEGTKTTYKGKSVTWKTKTPFNVPMWWTDDEKEHFADEVVNPTTKTTGGVDTSGYKSSYSSTSAAPKQVIVKIENLMNVESVDLANPDNAAAIADIKTQLTQALVDVVHDFDETYHG